MERIMNILMVSIALGASSVFGMGSAPSPSQPGFYSYNQHLNQVTAPYGYYPAQVVPDNQHQQATVNQYGYQGGQDARYQELSSSTPYKSSPFEEFLFNDDDQADDSEAVSSVARQLHEALSCSQKAEEDDNELIEEDSNELIAELLNQPETHDQNNGGNAQLRTSDEHFREFFGDGALAPEEEEEFGRAYTTQMLDSDLQPTVTPTVKEQGAYDKALFAAIKVKNLSKVKEALGTPENRKGNPYAKNSTNMTVLMAALAQENAKIVTYLVDHYPDHDWQADDGAGNTVEQLARLFKERYVSQAAQRIANYIIAKCRSGKQEVLPNNDGNAQLRTSDGQFSDLFGDDVLAPKGQPAPVITPPSKDQASYDNALFAAIKYKRSDKLKYALGTPENRKGNPYAVSHTKNYTNMTVLMAALAQGNGNTVAYLIDHYPDHDWQADDGAGHTVEGLAHMFKERHTNSTATRPNLRAPEIADYIIAKCRQQEVMPLSPEVLLSEAPLLSEEEDTRIPGTITATARVPLLTILRAYSNYWLRYS